MTSRDHQMESYRRLLAKDDDIQIPLNPSFLTPTQRVHINKVFVWIFRNFQRNGLIGASIFMIFLLVIFVSVTIYFVIKSHGILHNFKIDVSIMERPSCWTNSIAKAKIRSQGSCSSTFLVDGTVMWLFGFTLLNCSDCNGGWSLIDNTALYVTIENATIIDCQYPFDNDIVKTVIPEETNNESPDPNTALKIKDSVYGYWEVLESSNGQFSHFAFGRGILTGNSIDTYSFARFEADSTTATSGVSHVILSEDNQFVYVFMLRGEKYKDVVVARAPSDAINSTQFNFTFFTGKESDDKAFENDGTTLDDSKAIFSGIDDKVSIYFNKFLGQYCALIGGDHIAIRTSEKVWGTWSDPVKIYQIPEKEKGRKGTVQAHFHPELWKEEGRVMVFTYSVIGGDSDFLPQLVQIELDHI